MDSDICGWVMEFLLRSSVPNSLLQKTLTALPLSGADSRLKKTLLLHTLRSLLGTASLSETALQILEHLHTDTPPSDALRRAYCAVAVECTVKYLAASPDDPDGEFAAAVRRIWRGRVSALEACRSGLLSGELARWRNDIEAAIGDSSVRERLGRLNSRRDAMIEVTAFLKEASEAMGPLFLEKVAEMLKKKGEDVHDNENGNDSGNGNDNVCDNHNDSACMENVAMQQLHDENQCKEPLEERVDANEEVGGCRLTPQRHKVAIHKWNPPRKHKHSALRACHRGVKLSAAEEVEPATSCSKLDPVPSAEVRKASESLETSSLELRASFKDPLPDALHTSAVLRSKWATSDTDIEPLIENQSEDVDVPDPNVCQSIVLFQPSSANLEKKSPVHCSDIHHQPNLMERNRSARTFEWDDSIEDMPQGRQQRRRKRKWSLLEEETLRAGVKMFGEGNWATIRSFYSNIFDNRSGVDLKDKWRNMIR